MCKYAPLIWVKYARWPLYWGRFASSIFSRIGGQNRDQYGSICTKHLIKNNIFSKYWAHPAADCANIAMKGMKEKPIFSSIFHIYPYLPILSHIGVMNTGKHKLNSTYLCSNMYKYVQIWANMDQYSALSFHFHACSLRLSFVYLHHCVREYDDIQALFNMNHDMQSLLFFW
jgi:hypothetical protein